MTLSLYGKKLSQTGELLLYFGALWPIISSIYPNVIIQSLWREEEMRMDRAS